MGTCPTRCSPTSSPPPRRSPPPGPGRPRWPRWPICSGGSTPTSCPSWSPGSAPRPGRDASASGGARWPRSRRPRRPSRRSPCGDLDRTLDELAGLSGSGSQKARHDLLHGAPRPGHRGRAGLRPPPARRRAAPRRARGPGHRRHRQGLRRPAGRRAPGGDAGRRPARAWRSSPATRGEAGLAAVGLTVLRPVQPMLAPTAADVAEALALATGSRATSRRAGVGGVEARRRPHPGPPPGRRGRHLHPQPQRGHRPAARHRRPRPLAAGDERSCSTARWSAWARTSCPAPSRTR